MTTIPTTIVKNGTVDVTTDLTDFFNSLPDDDVVDFPALAQYRVDGTLELNTIQGQTWNGAGSRIFAVDTALGNATRSQVRFTNSANLNINNLIVEGAYPTAGVDAAALPAVDRQHAMEFASCTNVVVEKCEMHATPGDGIALTRVDAPCGCFTIQGNYITGIGRRGVFLEAAAGVVFIQNVIDDIKGTCIDMEHPETGYRAGNVTIQENMLGRNVGGPVSGSGALGDLIITDNFVNRLGFRFLGTDTPGGTGRAGNFTYVRNHAYLVAPGGGQSTWMILDGFQTATITENIMQFGGSTANFHRYLQLTDVGATELSFNTFVGLQANRLYTSPDSSPVTSEENYFWPLGYAVEPL